jgi:hypothetical protein
MYDKHDIRGLDDVCYPQVSYGPLGDMDITHEQATSLFRKWKQDQNDMSWVEFAKTVQPTFGMNGAIVVQWCNMWLAIETDGYTHS